MHKLITRDIYFAQTGISTPIYNILSGIPYFALRPLDPPLLIWDKFQEYGGIFLYLFGLG